MAGASRKDVKYFDWTYNPSFFAGDPDLPRPKNASRADGKPSLGAYAPLRTYKETVQAGELGKVEHLERVLNMYDGKLPRTFDAHIKDLLQSMRVANTPIDEQWAAQLTLAQQSLTQKASGVSATHQGYSSSGKTTREATLAAPHMQRSHTTESEEPDDDTGKMGKVDGPKKVLNKPEKVLFGINLEQERQKIPQRASQNASKPTLSQNMKNSTATKNPSQAQKSDSMVVPGQAETSRSANQQVKKSPENGGDGNTKVSSPAVDTKKTNNLKGSGALKANGGPRADTQTRGTNKVSSRKKTQIYSDDDDFLSDSYEDFEEYSSARGLHESIRSEEKGAIVSAVQSNTGPRSMVIEQYNLSSGVLESARPTFKRDEGTKLATGTTSSTSSKANKALPSYQTSSLDVSQSVDRFPTPGLSPSSSSITYEIRRNIGSPSGGLQPTGPRINGPSATSQQFREPKSTGTAEGDRSGNGVIDPSNDDEFSAAITGNKTSMVSTDKAQALLPDYDNRTSALLSDPNVLSPNEVELLGLFRQTENQRKFLDAFRTIATAFNRRETLSASQPGREGGSIPRASVSYHIEDLDRGKIRSRRYSTSTTGGSSDPREFPRSRLRSRSHRRHPQRRSRQFSRSPSRDSRRRHSYRSSKRSDRPNHDYSDSPAPDPREKRGRIRTKRKYSVSPQRNSRRVKYANRKRRTSPSPSPSPSPDRKKPSRRNHYNDRHQREDHRSGENPSSMRFGIENAPTDQVKQSTNALSFVQLPSTMPMFKAEQGTMMGKATIRY